MNRLLLFLTSNPVVFAGAAITPSAVLSMLAPELAPACVMVMCFFLGFGLSVLLLSWLGRLHQLFRRRQDRIAMRRVVRHAMRIFMDTRGSAYIERGMRR